MSNLRPRLAPAIAVASALALAGCMATSPPRVEPVPTPEPEVPVAAACVLCGKIERLETVASTRQAKPRGAVLGGVVGGVLTKPEPEADKAAPSAARSYRIFVRLDDGRGLILTQPSIAAGLKVGSRVRVERSRVVPLR